MEKEPKRWVTINGKHFPIYEDEQGNEVFGVGQEKEPFELTAGNGDAEIADSIEDYSIPKATRNKLEQIRQIKTYHNFKEYFKEQGIELNTQLKKLEERENDEIPAVKTMLEKIAVAVDSYKETFGPDSLKALKSIMLYDTELDTHAAYHFNLKGEHDPLAGTIRFSDWNASGRDIYHELGHAFQDSVKTSGDDVITYADKIAKSVGISNTSYKGTSGIGEQNAEMMAEQLAYGFSRGSKNGLSFIYELRKRKGN